MHDFGDSDNKINTKSNIIIVWANTCIKCQRPSTLWTDTFNDKFGPFIGLLKNLQNVLFLHGMSSLFFHAEWSQFGNQVTLKFIYVIISRCLFHIPSKCIAGKTMWKWQIYFDIFF